MSIKNAYTAYTEARITYWESYVAACTSWSEWQKRFGAKIEDELQGRKIRTISSTRIIIQIRSQFECILTVQKI